MHSFRTGFKYVFRCFYCIHWQPNDALGIGRGGGGGGTYDTGGGTGAGGRGGCKIRLNSLPGGGTTVYRLAVTGVDPSMSMTAVSDANHGTGRCTSLTTCVGDDDRASGTAALLAANSKCRTGQQQRGLKSAVK